MQKIRIVCSLLIKGGGGGGGVIFNTENVYAPKGEGISKCIGAYRGRWAKLL